MQWDQLTAADFADAVRETGVCAIAMGVVEKPGDHLPVGTDYLNGHRLACLAAEKEPAVVFPPFYFGQIYEARCFPGTLTIEPTLLIKLIRGVFDEIARNGFKKIVVVNAHGGNGGLLQFLAQCALWEEKPYDLGQKKEIYKYIIEKAIDFLENKGRIFLVEKIPKSNDENKFKFRDWLHSK